MGLTTRCSLGVWGDSGDLCPLGQREGAEREGREVEAG